MYTDSKIKNILSTGEYPCWILRFKQSKYGSWKTDYSHLPRKAKGDGVNMEESINMLNQRLEMLSGDPDMIFELAIKDIASSSIQNGDLRGPYEFCIEEDHKASDTGVNGLGNTGTVAGSPGFQTWQDYMDKKLELSEEKSAFKVEKIQFENEKAREWEKIAAENKKIEELEKEYTSDVNRAKKGASMAFKGLLDGIFDKEEKPALGNAEVSVQQEPLTPAEKMCESIAEHIADQTEDLSLIKQIGFVVAKMLKYPKLIPVFVKYDLITEKEPTA